MELDGFSTSIADEGNDALRIYREWDPDVVLLDVKMPGMSGIEVLKEIRDDASKTEVIIVTGHGDVNTAIQALREGAFSYLQKPLDYDELEIEIQKALDQIKMKDKLDEYVHNLEVTVEEKNKEGGSSLRDVPDPIFYQAPLLILFVGEKDNYWIEQDSVLSVQNMMLYAHSVGLGSCMIGRIRYLENRKDALEDLGVPENCRILTSVVFGYPEKVPEVRDRKPPHIFKSF